MAPTSEEGARTIVPLRIRKLADKTTSRVVMHRLGPGAATVEDDGTVVFDPGQAERILVNPDTPGYDNEPYPFVGVEFTDADGESTEEPNELIRVSQRYIAGAKAEGWIETEGEEIEYVPGGGPSNPTSVVHAFVKLDAVTFKTIHGDVRYRVTHNPGKYDDTGEASGYRIDWFYDLELEATP